MENKTLIIYASPNTASFTYKLLASAVENLADCTFFDCYKNIPLPCNDCGLCKMENACSQSDLDIFFKAFEKAEKVVIAFPVYNLSVPAPLKALLDRFQRFFSARFVRNERPPIGGKREVTVIMTMGGEEDVSEYLLKQLTPIFTISGCTLKKCYSLKGTDKLSHKDSLVPKIYNF